MAEKTTIDFATVTDSILDEEIYSEELANGMVAYKFDKLFQNKLGVIDDSELSNYLLFITDDTVLFSKNLDVIRVAIDESLHNESVTIFEYETILDIMKYLNDFYSGVEYGVGEI